MVLIPKKFDYLGIDKTSLGIGNNSSIVVAAETNNIKLTKIIENFSLLKAKDIIREAIAKEQAPKFPQLEELKVTGLNTFYWTRAKGGRFSLKELQHASIAHVVQHNGYKPKSTIIFIDAFYGNYQKSQFLIQEYLHRREFEIPLENINICGKGDKSIPIINYADLLAFQIGLNLNERHREYNPKNVEFPFHPNEIDFDEQRVMLPLDENGRNLLEKVLRDW